MGENTDIKPENANAELKPENTNEEIKPEGTNVDGPNVGNVTSPERAREDGGTSNKLKYPVLMVHGMGFRDNKLLCYWGRIPKAIQKEVGCDVYFGLQDSNGAAETNGEYLAERIDKLCAEHGIEKFNVIAHSKGGQDMRYAITSLQRSNRVASLTTINTPHNGSKTVDLLLKVPAWPVKVGCKVCDLWFMIIGDKKPDTYKCIKLFETKNAKAFNDANPDVPGIYYQSYGFTCKTFYGDIFMWFPNLFVRLIEGENDGLLTVDAVRWTNFRGHFHSTTNRGISHCDEVDMRRMRFTRKPPKNEFEISDITDFYRNVVRELAEKGF
ncbi:MAG: alpha/beta hydrolase [Lachnospiraceae bacterium]|nr:alpha/beta hydrolase [Lachnospiraceae bacterium]